MNTNNRQLDAFGVPVWIGDFCNQHQTLFLSDTRTYRLLMVIYRAIMEMRVPTETSETDREEAALSFMTWFLQLGNSMPALPGLMWIHQEIGKKLMASKNAGAIADDERLGRLLMAFIVLSDKGEDDASCKRYHGMIGEGWSIPGHDADRESLYRGFVATLVAHSDHELVALGKDYGVSGSKLRKVMRCISNKSRSATPECPLQNGA